MPSCLGLYIEDKLIKYAKVSKEKDMTKIENFGVEFYDDLEKKIAQIIDETSSERTAINVNLTGETYDYFKIFSLLSKKDLEDAIATEVETLYFEKGISQNNVETRYMLSPIKEETDRLRVLNISANKAQIIEKTNLIGNGRLHGVSPLPVILPELLKIKETENSLIINIEDKTIFTSIINGQVYEIEKTTHGMSEILERINFKENSYSKAYDICKNTTIYTSDITDVETDTNMYLEDIMPTLYEIVQDMIRITEKLPKKVSKIYITGSAALINNVDMYFKEYVEEAECVLLKPVFIDNAKTKINIKDYIEVNSAIALAITALEQKQYNINFLTKGNKKIKNSPASKSNKPKKSGSITMPEFNLDLTGPFDSIEMSFLRGIISLFLIFALYAGFSSYVTKSINDKNTEITQVKTGVQQQISLATTDLNKIQSKVSSYKKMTSNLEAINQKVAEAYRTKNEIPNLLYHIMNIIPVNVQITSIEQTSDRHIVIQARTTDYQYFAYFTAGLKTGGILNNVVSGTATKTGEIINVTIEGDLQ